MSLAGLVHLALQIIKQANHFDVCLGVASLEEKADGRDAGVGVLGAGVLGQQKTRLEPGLLLQCAGTAGGAVGAHGLSALLRGLGWLVCGIREGCEGAWLRWLIIVVRDAAVCEQGGLSWIVDAYPHHECLDEFHVQTLLQKEQAGLRVMHRRVCVGVGKDTPEKSCAIVQAAYVSLKFLNLFITSVQTNSEAAIRGVLGQSKA